MSSCGVPKWLIGQAFKPNGLPADGYGVSVERLSELPALLVVKPPVTGIVDMTVLDDQLEQEDIADVSVTNLVVIKQNHKIVASIFVRVDDAPIELETVGNEKEAQSGCLSTVYRYAREQQAHGR